MIKASFNNTYMSSRSLLSKRLSIPVDIGTLGSFVDISGKPFAAVNHPLVSVCLNANRTTPRGAGTAGGDLVPVNVIRGSRGWIIRISLFKLRVLELDY